MIKELVKQLNSNFQEKDVAQIIKSYVELKRQQQTKKERRTCKETKILDDTIKTEIKEKGKNINISALAKKLESRLQYRTYGSIMAQIHRLIKRPKNIQEENNELKTTYKEKNMQQMLDDLFKATDSMIIPSTSMSEITNEEVSEKSDSSSNGYLIWL